MGVSFTKGIFMDDYQNPKPGKTYISPTLKSFADGKTNIRIASKVMESKDSYAFAKIKDELILRHAENAKTHITAKFIEEDRKIFVLNIQGYTTATEKPHNASFSFVGEEIGKLLEFVRNIKSVDLKNSSKINITDEELNRIILSNNQAKSLISENRELFEELIKSEITSEDIVAVGKKQLSIFFDLLTKNNVFQKLKEKKSCSSEALWQLYFEKNQWIFGYGLGYVFLSNLDEKKLEQVVQGFSLNSHGKRVDAVMKTKGVISNLCFVEIKTHETALLENKPYRSGCWSPSKELAGAIAQVQNSSALAVESLSSKINLEDKLGNPTGEEIFNYQPKSYLVIGSLDEFKTENGVNQDKLRSFELLRKNTANPEIITFDELYERARYIVRSNES